MLLVVFFIFYSGLIEWLKPSVIRYREWPDMLANTAAVVCNIALAIVIKTFSKRLIVE